MTADANKSPLTVPVTAPNRHEPPATDADVEKDYQEFWVKYVFDGQEPTPQQVKQELYDYHVFMSETAKVYDHLTGGRISKIETSADAVIAVAEDVMNELIQIAIKEHDEEKQDESDQIPPTAHAFTHG